MAEQRAPEVGPPSAQALRAIAAAPGLHAGMGILLERFGVHVGAGGAALVLADHHHDGPPLRHRWRLNDAAEAAALLRLVRDVVERSSPGSLAIGEGHAGRVVATVPVGAHGRARAVLCAVFDGRPAVAAPDLEDLAATYAALAWLRLGGDDLIRLRRVADQDPLTGCLNGRAARELLAEEVARCAREGGRLTCCLLDIHGFGALNLHRGSLAGDRVLVDVAAALGAGARVLDGVGRHGRDQFLVVMPETPPGVAGEMTARFISDVRAVGRGVGHVLDACAGVASWAPDTGHEDLLRDAVHALAGAKVRGAGAVFIADADALPA